MIIMFFVVCIVLVSYNIYKMHATHLKNNCAGDNRKHQATHMLISRRIRKCVQILAS